MPQSTLAKFLPPSPSPPPRHVQSVECAGSDIPTRNRRGHRHAPAVTVSSRRCLETSYPPFSSLRKCRSCAEMTPRHKRVKPRNSPSVSQVSQSVAATSHRGSPLAASANAVRHTRRGFATTVARTGSGRPRHVLRSQIVHQVPSVQDFPDYRKDSFQISSFPSCLHSQFWMAPLFLLQGLRLSVRRRLSSRAPRIPPGTPSGRRALWRTTSARGKNLRGNGYPQPYERCLITHDSRYRMPSSLAAILSWLLFCLLRTL